MITEQNFVLVAAKYYDNPECHTAEEFAEDLNKIKYLKKIFKRYKETGEINVRLALNYVIIFYNLFGSEGATRLLFFKLGEEYADVLVPFLTLLGFLPRFVVIDGTTVATSSIPLDSRLFALLRNL